MSITRSHSFYGDDLYQDRIVLFGSSPRTLPLLQLALIRSDNAALLGHAIRQAILQECSEYYFLRG